MDTTGDDSTLGPPNGKTPATNSISEEILPNHSHLQPDAQGRFSLNLLSLQLQLGTLLEDAGGSPVMALLDALAGLPAGARATAIAACMRVIHRLSLHKAGTNLSAEEHALRELEEGLYRDIMRALTTQMRIAEVASGETSLVKKTHTFKVVPAVKPQLPPGGLEGEANSSGENKATGAAPSLTQGAWPLPLSLLEVCAKKEGKLVRFPCSDTALKTTQGRNTIRAQARKRRMPKPARTTMKHVPRSQD